ncbi:hypothetical protein MTR_1g110450 [Medicago truncatula]|uniref:Uncharacterized protein n=1 Tax=Medicago truncatula TaxID=3880 RepID=G7ICA4_MEDTR|nr:hypothetical protein MTR_1g110450 [Medicago truncatula]
MRLCTVLQPEDDTYAATASNKQKIREGKMKMMVIDILSGLQNKHVLERIMNK